jgi:hypothetical protein
MLSPSLPAEQTTTRTAPASAQAPSSDGRNTSRSHGTTPATWLRIATEAPASVTASSSSPPANGSRAGARPGHRWPGTLSTRRIISAPSILDLTLEAQRTAALSKEDSCLAADFAGYAQIARQAAVGNGQGVVAALTLLDAPTDRLMATLQRHHIAELTIRTLEADLRSPSLADAMRATLNRRRPFPAVDAHALLAAYSQLQAALHEADIPVLILKGAVLAQRLYGGLERRPQFDIDVLVPRSDVRSAQRTIADLGYQRDRRDPHALTLRRGPVKLDLHWALRSAPAYAIDEHAVWDQAVEVQIDALRARTLSDNYLLALLSASAVEDAALGMVKLKQLCDLWLLARELDARFDWEAWFRARSRERMESVVTNGCALALKALDVTDDAPRLRDALQARSDVVRIRDRDHALALAAAPREHPPNMRWFAEVYPGSPLLYRLRSFAAGFPASIRDAQISRYVPRRPRAQRR